MSEESWNEEHFTTKENHFDDVPSSTAIDNILRLNQTNIMNLTLMADTKANIMITVSSIVFSVTLSNMDSEILKWPLTFLGVFSMIALIFAIIVILPKTGYPKTHDGDIDRKSPFYNPLFFGHFAHIPLDEFKSEYAQRLEKDSRTYDAVVGNIYGLGRVLATNKFKYLKLSYTSFLIGLVSAMSVFVLGHFDINIFSITETISNELTFTWEGVKVLLCKLSERC
tara:strand:- start:949 stop:1623 length:675 start_codon:yes stop_codon:yes gene_type:complete